MAGLERDSTVFYFRTYRGITVDYSTAAAPMGIVCRIVTAVKNCAVTTQVPPTEKTGS
jgi:hypothetical protein